MQPGQFLALLQESQQEPERATAPARLYRALEASAAPEHFLTLHTPGGKIAALAYSGLSQISGDHAAGTRYRLKFPSTYVDLEGVKLAPVFEAIRTRRAAHLHQLDKDRHDPPTEEAPVILAIQFRAIKAAGDADTPARGDRPPQRAAE